MSVLNNSTIDSQVQQKIDSVSTTTAAIDLLFPEVIASTGRKASFAATVNDLPNIETESIPNGQIFYVDSIATFVVANTYKWLGLDGRILRDDKSTVDELYSWGLGPAGRLGNGFNINRSSPVLVAGGFTDWCQTSVGFGHAAAVRTNGTLWTWGYNIAGQLGIGVLGILASRSSPVSVLGGFTDWCQVSAGGFHTAAIKTNGTMWTWGSNGSGQLGQDTGATASITSPASVVGGFTDWCQVSTSLLHTAAIRTNGTAWTWGSNICGQLGDGTTVTKSSPVSVVGGFTDWCRVATGCVHTLGLKTDGTVWAWGDGGNGRLGDGTSARRCSPVSVVGGITDWCQIAAGSNHSAGVRTNGSLWTWGDNTCGQLGLNDISTRFSPVSVVGGFTDWCWVSASCRFSVAVRTDGTLWAWGCNDCGQLGDNSIVNRSSPVSVVGDLTNWCRVSAGYGFSVAISSR